MPSKAETYSNGEEAEEKKDPYENKSLEQLEAELKRLQKRDPDAPLDIGDPDEWGVTERGQENENSKGIPNCMLYGKNWTFRFMYLGFNIILCAMLATTPNTAMWRENGTIDIPYLTGFAIYMSITWVSYLLVQGSDPGFIDQDEYERSNISKLEEGFVRTKNSKKIDKLKAAQPFKAGEMETELTVNRKQKMVRGGNEESKQELDEQEVEVDLHEPEDEDEIDLNDDDERDDAVFLKWKEWPPMRAGYCKAAKRWVAMYDHWCPFLGTPIGERNHCRFWWFLLFQTMSLNWGIALCHTGFIEHTWAGGGWMSVNGHALVTAFFLYCCLLGCGPLFLFHTFLAMANITTSEFMRADEVDYLKGTQEFDLPFANSFCFNLRFFCCEQVMRRVFALLAFSFVHDRPVAPLLLCLYLHPPCFLPLGRVDSLAVCRFRLCERVDDF